MKNIELAFIAFLFSFLFASCIVSKEYSNYENSKEGGNSYQITQSLFSDKSASISEENIQKILAGKIQYPEKVKIAIINLDKPNTSRYRYSSSGGYGKTFNQNYMDCMSNNLKTNKKVGEVVWIPSMMVGTSPSFTLIREAAVRMQADLVIIYSVLEEDIYTRHKTFSSDYKGYATTQAVVMDVRTGLTPYTDISSESFVIPKEDEKKNKSFNGEERRRKIQEEAVLLTLNNISKNIINFLN